MWRRAKRPPLARVCVCVSVWSLLTAPAVFVYATESDPQAPDPDPNALFHRLE